MYIISSTDFKALSTYQKQQFAKQHLHCNPDLLYLCKLHSLNFYTLSAVSRLDSGLWLHQTKDYKIDIHFFAKHVVE